MNITKRILITGALFIGCNIQTSELTPVLQKHLTRDTAGIVEQYVWDGTLALDPQESIVSFYSSRFWGLTQKDIAQWKKILKHINQSLPSCEAIDFYCDDHAAITYTFTNPGIQNKLIRIIPYQCMANKKAGATIIVMDSDGNTYDFLLTEDKEANMKEVTFRKRYWSQGEATLQALIEKGFTGEHAQMVRFLCDNECQSGLANNKSRIIYWIATGEFERTT